MNPGDFILLFLSLGFGGLSLVAHGWTLHGIGPAVLATAGGFWQLWLQWLRHRSWVRHKDERFSPGTQHLALAAWLGWALTMLAAVTWAMLTLANLRQ